MLGYLLMCAVTSIRRERMRHDQGDWDGSSAVKPLHHVAQSVSFAAHSAQGATDLHYLLGHQAVDHGDGRVVLRLSGLPYKSVCCRRGWRRWPRRRTRAAAACATLHPLDLLVRCL